MVETGLMFEKETEDLTRAILDFFEKTRYAYLSAREDKAEYEKEWHEVIDKIRDDYDSLNKLSEELKKYLEEKVLFDKSAKDPTTLEAKKVYEAVKDMRFQSKKVSDPFSKKFEGDVINTLLESDRLFIAFIHYALRSHSNALPDKIWEEHDMEGDDITQGVMGLDLEMDDIPLYIIEHYGAEDEDQSRIKSKFKGALKQLDKMFNGVYEDEQWDNLVELDLEKSEDEKSEDEKSEIDFIIPNKPMYRIFELDDLKELKGFTGEWLVQEKYDGMRIQLHKKKDNIKIYSYNKKDITDKCEKQVEQLKKKQFGDCILDGELVLFEDDEPLHRASTIAHVFKNKKGGELRAHVFDIMQHEGKDIHDEPLRERHNVLLYQFSQHSSDALAFPSKKDTRVADSVKEVGEYAKDIMQLPASEGVVIKDMESTYPITKKKNPKWIKWKKFVDLDVIVLDKKSTNNGMHTYTMGVGPITAEEARTYTTTDMDDKAYVPVGKALNTKVKVSVGDIVRVKVDEVKKNKKGFNLYSAKVIEIPEVTQSDKLSTLERLSTKTKKSLTSDAIIGVQQLSPFKITTGLRDKDNEKKSYMITDNVHGTAEIIMKSDFDGFTIYGFEGDSLMQKNALYNLDMWKSELERMLKTRRSELRIAIKNEIIDIYKNKPTAFPKIVDFVKKEFPETYEEVFQSSDENLMSWMKKQDSLRYHHPNKFTAIPDVLEKDVEELKKRETGSFSIVLREDGNLDFIMNVNDKRNFWEIDIEDTEDIYDLFGKSGKFPAIVGKKLGQHKKEIDSGKLILGVQKEGYHEYKLEGDKFDTRFHVRVVPLDEKQTWVVWTGKKQEMLDMKDDTKLWDITEDKYADLSFPTKKSD